jgi:hypothetical protein
MIAVLLGRFRSQCSILRGPRPSRDHHGKWWGAGVSEIELSLFGWLRTQKEKGIGHPPRFVHGRILVTYFMRNLLRMLRPKRKRSTPPTIV